MKRLKAVLAILFFNAVTASAKDPYVNMDSTLCVPGERIYISCSFDEKSDSFNYNGPVASLCAKDNVSPQTGYVQYRYGVPGSDYSGRLEMEFPKKKIPPGYAFKIYDSDGPHGIALALRFTNGNHTYSFERGDSFAGYRVVVRTQGRKVFSKQCTLPGTNGLNDNAYLGIEHVKLGQNPISDW